jgi:hypothetical protein
MHIAHFFMILFIAVFSMLSLYFFCKLFNRRRTAEIEGFLRLVSRFLDVLRTKNACNKGGIYGHNADAGKKRSSCGDILEWRRDLRP